MKRTVYPSGASPLSGRYLVKSQALRAALSVRDALWSLGWRSRPAPIPDMPRRVLIAVGGQLGDAVIATAALRQLRRAVPTAELSVLCPPMSAQVFDGHPELASIHAVDHWFWDRRSRNPGAMWKRWRQMEDRRAAATAEIAGRRFDMAIDLYPFFPNSSPLLAAAGIPVRVGYASGGGAPLFTHPVRWRETRAHVAQQHAALIQRCWPGREIGPSAYDLPPLPEAAIVSATALLRSKGIHDDAFIVLHPGTSDERKRWPTRLWIALARSVAERGELRVVLTGHGASDRAAIEEITSAVPSAVSLCDQTDWRQFRHVLSVSRAVVSADSVAAHVGAASARPTVSIMAAMSDPEHWRPMGERSAPTTANVPCAPCFLSRGCAAMTCVRDVSVDAVLGALQRVAT